MLILDPSYMLNIDEFYDKIVDKDNIFRRILELVDFSFFDNLLKDTYSEDMGRPAYRPQMMVKYLIIKYIFELSDRDLVKRCKTDMSCKYFLGINPTDEPISATTLCKFRRNKLKSDSIVNTLIKVTLDIAVKNKITISPTLIVDSTHSEARYGVYSARETALEVCKQLRKSIYKINPDYKSIMPEKPNNHLLGIYENAINYCYEVIKVVEEHNIFDINESIKTKYNHLKEILDDIQEALTYSNDKDAKIGHKTADTSFFGYKTHIGMSPERIITCATVTSGEKYDGAELERLIDLSIANGVKITSVVGDGAYSDKNNITICEEKGIKLISKLSKCVLTNTRKNKLEFTYNKDAKMYVCPNGHMAIRKGGNLHKSKDENQALHETYFFDVEKCKICPLKDKCGYKGSKTKSYSVRIKMGNIHVKHQELQCTDEYIKLAEERYKIEAKNAELKNSHMYDVASYNGIEGMYIQAAVTIFIVNIKRIINIMNSQKKKEQKS